MEFHAYWRHEETGDVYAVMMVPYGVEDVQVTGVCGPLSRFDYLVDPEVPSNYNRAKLSTFTYDTTTSWPGTIWIERRMGEFDQVADDQRRVSVNQVRAGKLPQDATGIYWLHTSYSECRAHLTEPTWSTDVTPSDEPCGVVLTEATRCDACDEVRRDHLKATEGAQA